MYIHLTISIHLSSLNINYKGGFSLINLKHDIKISITHYNDKHGNSGQGHIEPMLSELYDLLQTPKVVGDNEENKLRNGLITSGKVTGQRSNDNVKHKNILVYDVDDLPEGYSLFDEVSALYSGAFALYSTYKHTERQQRYRLLIPVNRNLTPVQYGNLMKEIENKIQLKGLDGSSYTLSQPFALPVVKSSNSLYEFKYQDAPIMELTDTHLKQLSHGGRKFKVEIGNAELYKKNSSDEWEEFLKPMVQHDGRNIAMTKILGHLLYKNVEPIIAYRLLERWNDGHIEPMDKERFDRTFRSIFERHIRNKGGVLKW